MRKLWMAALLGLLAYGSAQAQVYKCQDPAGRLLLSDQPCANGELVQKKRTAEEKQQDDERAALAVEQKQQRRAQEQASRRPNTPDQPPPAASQPPASANSANSTGSASESRECQAAKRDLEFASASISRTEPERRAKVNAAITQVNASCGTQTELIQEPPPPSNNYGPPTITHCNSSGCYDNYGRFYSRSGPQVLMGPDNITCNALGNSWHCVQTSPKPPR